MFCHSFFNRGRLFEKNSIQFSRFHRRDLLIIHASQPKVVFMIISYVRIAYIVVASSSSSLD